MNTKLAATILGRVGHVDALGCVSDFVDHPNPAFRKSRCVEVGIVFEHRFAFAYWLKCKQKLQYDVRTRIAIDDETFRPPDLVSWIGTTTAELIVT
jgi:hypothetical protein